MTLPQVAGSRPLSVRLVNAYVDRFQAAAEHDIALTERFFRVAGLLDPPSLLLRVMTGTGPGRSAHTADGPREHPSGDGLLAHGGRP